MKGRFRLLFVLSIVCIGLFSMGMVLAAGNTTNVTAQPTSCTGWQNASKAEAIDLLGSSDLGSFSGQNSSFFYNSPTPADALSAPSNILDCASFTVTDSLPARSTITRAAVSFSFAAKSYPENEDVVSFAYSLDGTNWTTLDSFALTGDTSNAIHEGYREYPVTGIRPETLAQLRVRVTYFATEPTHESVSFLDSVQLQVSYETAKGQKPLALPNDVAVFTKKDFKQSEQPSLDVEVEHRSLFGFLGVDPTVRAVHSIRVVDPHGVEREGIVTEQRHDEGRKTFEQYSLDPANFTSPGKYEVIISIEQDGQTEQVQKEFSWGVLVMNTMKSVYRPGETAHFGMGVLDPSGHTICDAQLELRITDPKGRTAHLTTAKSQIRYSQECGPDNVTNLPDYSAEYGVEGAGDYALVLTATTGSGTYTITDTLFVRESIPFDIIRIGPTRIFPKANYEMFLEIVPTYDYKGTVEEFVPSSLSLIRIDQAGTSFEVDKNTTGIRWNVDWKAGLAYTLSYQFDPPDVSPDLHVLGPAKVGSFQEYRQWQIASDSTGSGAPTRQWMTGFENNTTTADIEYTANVGSPTVQTTTVRSGTYAMQTNVSATTAGFSNDFESADAATGHYFREYVRFTTLPNANTLIMAIRDSGATNQASIRYDNTNAKFELWNEEDSAQIGSDSTGTITTGTWYRLEMYVDFGTAATGDTIVKARLNGTEFAAATNVNWANGVMTMQGGIITTNATANAFIDDVAINLDSTTSVAGEGYPGEGKIIYLRPNGNGTNTAWTGDSTAVDEVTPNDGTDVISCSASAQAEDYTLTDATANGVNALDTIKVLQTYVRVGNSSSGSSHNYSIVLNLSGTADTVSNVTIATATTWFTIDDTKPRNPTTTIAATGNVSQGQVSYDKPGTTTDPWTPADVDSAQVNINTGDCAPVTNISTVWVEVEYVAAEGGRLYSSGFELQSTTADMEYTANVGSPTISTSTVRSGAASLRANPSATTAGMSYDFRSADDATATFFRAYVRFTTFPNANTLIMAIRDNAATNQASIRFDNVNSKFELWNEEDSAQIGSDSAAISTGEWYRIEMKVDFGTAATGDTVVEAQLDGTQIATSSTVNWANGIKTLQLGIITTSATADEFIDDVAINQNAGSVQNGYPGAGQIVHLRPDANGDNTAWAVNVNGCAATDYTCVDEVTPNDATDVVGSTTLNQVEEYNLDATATPGIPSNAPITLASVGIRFNNSAATLSAVKVRLKDAANALPIESYYIDNTTNATYFTNNETAPRIYGLTAYDRPNLTTAWTTTELDSAQIGVRLGVDGGANNFGVSAMWLLVEYVPTITITGTVRDGGEVNGTDCSALNHGMGVTTNAGSTRTGSCTAADGTFTIAADAPRHAGDPIALFLTSVGAATTVTLAADTTSNIANLDLFYSRVAVRYENAGPMTNAKLASADNGNANILYSVSGSALTVDSGYELHIWNGKTYTPGGTVTTQGSGGDLHVDDSGTATLDTATNTIAGDIKVDASATMNINASTNVQGGDIATSGSGVTVTYSGTPTVTITGTGNIGGGTTPTLNFYNLTIGTATAAASTVKNNMTVNNVLNVDTSDSMSIDSGMTVTLAKTSGSSLTLNGTVSGAGRLTYNTTTTFPTAGTISSILRFDITTNTVATMSARTYGGDVEAYSNGVACDITCNVTMGTAGGQTITISGNIIAISASANDPTFFTAATNDPTVNVTGNVSFDNSGGGGPSIRSGAGTWTVSGNFDCTNGSFITETSSTLKMDGVSKSIVGCSLNSLYNFTVDPTSASTITANTSNFTVSNTLTVAAGDTLSISSGVTVTHTGATLTWGDSTSTISGAGTLRFTNVSGGPGSGGTLSSIVRYDATAGNVASTTFDARTYGGKVEIYSNSTTARTVTFATGTYTTSGASSHLYVISDGASPGDLTLDGATNSPTVTIGGDLDYTGGGTSSEIVSSGTNTWTVSGNVDFTGGTFTATAGNTLVMNGTSKTLTSAAQTLQNLTLSGTITLANATHTVNGNLDMAGGTITAGSSTVTMTGTGGKTITGGGNTLANLAIDPSSADTITLQTSDLSASAALTVAASDTLSINASRTMTVTSAGSLSLSGTISGSGKLTYKPSASFPTGGTISSILRFDSTDNDQTMGARTYGGAVEVFNTSGSSRTVTAAAGTLAFSSTLDISKTGGGGETLELNTNDPTTTISGAVTIGSGTTFSANSANALNINGNYTNSGTFTDNSGTVTVAGSAQQTFNATMTGSSDFNNLTITNNSGSDPVTSPSVIFSASATTAGTFTATTANVKLRFFAGGTYTFQNISFNGQATTSRVALRSSSAGTDWNLNVAGTRSVLNTDAKDSDACGQAPNIDATDISTLDSTGNTCWDFSATQFSISDTTIGFGAITASTGRWATGDTNGTDASATTPTAAHTISIRTSAGNGYALTYFGATLTSSGNTICQTPLTDCVDATDDSDGAPGTEQFGISVSTDGNATIAAGYLRDSAASFNFIPSTTTTIVSETGATATETITASYLANIAALTEPGAYLTNITYILTATF